MTSPSERAMEKARVLVRQCQHLPVDEVSGDLLDQPAACDECIAHALDAREAEVWEAAAKIADEWEPPAEKSHISGWECDMTREYLASIFRAAAR